MPATSTKHIYNFKGNFAAATAALLATYGWSDAYIERESRRLKAAVRQEITFHLGEAINEAALADGSHVYDFYAARLLVRIVTARRENQSSPDSALRNLHDQYVAETLDALEERKNPFTEELLPYYAVKTIRPLGTRSDLDLTFFEDHTEIEFALQFGIRSTAWPV